MIIARIGSLGACHCIFVGYFNRRDRNMRTIELGSSVRQRIFISENLTKLNSVLRGRASAYKHGGLIFHSTLRVVIREGHPTQAIYLELDMDNRIANGGSCDQERSRKDHRVQYFGQRAGIFSTLTVGQFASCLHFQLNVVPPSGANSLSRINTCFPQWKLFRTNLKNFKVSVRHTTGVTLRRAQIEGRAAIDHACGRQRHGMIYSFVFKLVGIIFDINYFIRVLHDVQAGSVILEAVSACSTTPKSW